MGDPDILRHNERLKVLSNFVFNLAVLLLAALIARAFEVGVLDMATLSWLVGEIALVAVGWSMLGLLEAET